MKLLLIAPSTRAMAESAKKARYNFITLDYFGDVDQKEICENYSLNHEFKEEYSIENLFKHSRDLNFTHLVYGAGFENHPEFIADFEKRCVVLGNDYKTIENVRDWDCFFRILKKNGILFPKTEIVPLNEAEEVTKATPEKIIKPIKSGGGHGIYDSENFSEREDDEGLDENEVLLQEFLNGEAISSTVISSDNGCLCAGITEQIIGNAFNKYRYCGNIMPFDEKKKVLRKIEEISCEIAQIFKLKGSNGIDFILKNEQLYVLEVNPRLTGSMEVIEKACGINILDLHVKSCLNRIDRKALEPKINGFYGKKILFSEKNLNFCLNERLDSIKDVPHFNEYIEEKSPICTVLGEGKTRAECYKDLIKKENGVTTLLNGSI